MKIVYSLLVVLVFSLSSYAQTSKSAAVDLASIEIIHSNITLDRAAQLTKNSKNIIYLDVRTPEEIKTGKIANALEMDVKATDFSTKLDQLDKTKTYIVYCHAGGRSEVAAKMMKSKGFMQVYNMTGGWKEYSAKNVSK